MNPSSIEEAARQLIAARNGGELIEQLDEALQPATVDAAHAIQDATVAQLGDAVAGWKVASFEGQVVRGVLLASRVFDSPARIPAALVPMLGVEVEIAFRLDRDLPARADDYSYEEVAAAVTALPALEIVDSRFKRYAATPVLHRMADCVSNGAFVIGSPRADWRKFDLESIKVSLAIDEKIVVDKAGGHPTIDPLLPVVALVNRFRTDAGIKAGRVVTTGTYTGMLHVRPGQTVVGRFADFGSVQASFV
jgi:2-keto-4-pentenoate hydratase